nr:MAG TPA: hypothetical protein [Caudoviricetes sp.]
MPKKDSDEDNWNAAKERSDRVRDVINSLTVSGYFNASVMTGRYI